MEMWEEVRDQLEGRSLNDEDTRLEFLGAQNEVMAARARLHQYKSSQAVPSGAALGPAPQHRGSLTRDERLDDLCRDDCTPQFCLWRCTSVPWHACGGCCK